MAHDEMTNDLLCVSMGCLTAFLDGLSDEPVHCNTVATIRSVMGEYTADHVLLPLIGLTLSICRTLADERGESVEQVLIRLGIHVAEFTSQDQGG